MKTDIENNRYVDYTPYITTLWRGDNPVIVRQKPKYWLHLSLFALTIASTWLMWGPWYSLGIMLFLTSHEMGHYLMCRRYNVDATLPFFIPFPILNPFGTMGAFIRIKSPIPHKKALFDIGAAGPLAGFIIALPLEYWGLKLSTIVPATELSEGAIYLGDSLLGKAMAFLVFGPLAEGTDISLHPLAYAGWVALFVTAMNLLPIGQLDGGHVFYSLFGKLSNKANIVFLAGFGILTIINPVWIVFFVLLVIFGRYHPEPLDDFTPINPIRRLLGYFIFIIFALTFTPMPFNF